MDGGPLAKFRQSWEYLCATALNAIRTWTEERGQEGIIILQIQQTRITKIPDDSVVEEE